MILPPLKRYNFKTLLNFKEQLLYIIFKIVLFYDTQYDDSRSNDAQFMHKLSKQA